MKRFKNYWQIAAVYLGIFFSVFLYAAGKAQAKAPLKSDWIEGQYSIMRLFGANLKWQSKQASFVGVEIKLDPGWKTYWRSPGSSGLAPIFDLSGSTNVASHQVLYPLPKQFVDPTGVTFGYKYSVIFPIKVTPKLESKPIEIKLKAMYGVCKDVCVPEHATAKIHIPVKGISFFAKSRMRRVLNVVPVPFDDPSDLFESKIETSADETNFQFKIKKRGKMKNPVMFVEDKAGRYIPAPKLIETTDDHYLFQSKLKQKDHSFDLKKMICTIGWKGHALEGPCIIARKGKDQKSTLTANEKVNNKAIVEPEPNIQIKTQE